MTTPLPARPAPVTVQLDPAGFVRLRWIPGVTITGELARDAVNAVDRVCAGQPRPMLVDMAATAKVTREARAVFAGKSSASAIALLGKSAVDRVIANFVLGITTVPVPTRFFTAEPDAVGWLIDARDAAGS